MGQVFLSYSRENKTDAERIRDQLQALGFQIWFDQRDLQANEDIGKAIDDRIAKVDAVLVLWSAAARESVWVRGEALSGLSANKYVGALLERMIPSVPFNARNAADLSDWTGLNQHPGWDLLVRSLASMVGASGSAILQHLGSLQTDEKLAAEKKAALQAALPLEEVSPPPLEEEHAYRDVDALLNAADAILSGAGRLDLSSAMTQAALDQELIRAADLVVGSNDPNNPKTIQAAIDLARPGDLIAVHPGKYIENLKIRKPVRLIGLGFGNLRPLLIAKTDQAGVDFLESARLENFAVETNQRAPAIHCTDKQPVLVRCVISRFSKQKNPADAAFYVAGKANPIVIATSVTSSDCPSLYFVTSSGGTFLGASVTAYRGAAVFSRGQPKFRACVIEAIGGPAVQARTNGYPVFEDCEISGRGASVISVTDKAYPQIRDSRVHAVRQYAFDFAGESAGRYERNIVGFTEENDSQTTAKETRDWFGFFRSKQDAIVNASARNRHLVNLRGTGRPVFISNTTTDGVEITLPSSPAPKAER